MAGAKGKSGTKKGKVNNPSGRPEGALNKVSASVKSRIVTFVEDDFDGYMERLKDLENRDYVKAMTELIKLVVPRALNEEETQSNQLRNEMIKRMMGEKPEQA
jgi:hypothetical protein